MGYKEGTHMTPPIKSTTLFLFISSLLLMVPVVYIAWQYAGVYQLLNSALGTLGLAALMLLVYYLLKPINQFLAKTLAISLFFAMLLLRIVLAFVYDFSGRGFTSEFFAHFSLDSFLIGFQQYGGMLMLAIAAMLMLGWQMAQLLRTSQTRQILVTTSMLGLCAVLLLANKRNLPEYRLFQAYQNYSQFNIEVQDIGTTRAQAMNLLQPLRKSTNLPPEKQLVTAQPPENPKNLIIIYLESFSDVLTENPRYPGLTPNLDRLKDQHFSFDQYYSAGYVTIEGIANSLCGTLMNMESGENSLTSEAGRLPDLPCLTDVLQVAGYHQVFMGGADLEFAGKGAFLSEHGYDEVWGRYKWEANGFESANIWGLSDTELFEQAFVRAKEMSQSGQFFNLTLLTLGTHIPGYTYSGCEPYDQEISDHSFINGIHCTDQLVGQFIDRLEHQGILENTVVQIQGDHSIFPTHEMYSLFGQNGEHKKIFNVTIAPDIETLDHHQNIPSSTINMAANLLDLLEVEHNASFLLSSSDFSAPQDDPYFISRYSDYYAGQIHHNYAGDQTVCDDKVFEPSPFPLGFCHKRQLLKAIYQVGATYAKRNIDQQVCSLGVEISLDEQNKKVRARWGNKVISDQFSSSGRTFSDSRQGFYLVELDHRDHAINQVFFNPAKVRDMDSLEHVLTRRDNRFLLFSNLPSKTIKRLKINNLPDNFIQQKLLYSKNQSSLLNDHQLSGQLGFFPASCGDAVEVFTYSPNPAMDQAIFCEVDSWGPQKIRLGTPFNEQPNGDSAFWFKTACAEPGSQISFDGVLLKTVERLPTVTARIDTDVLITSAGTYKLAFFHPETSTEYYIGELTVLPNDDYVPIIPTGKASAPSDIQQPLLIAHAGGGINQKAYANSLEALNHNYQLGHRFFEIDFSWTADQQLVALHDWGQTHMRFFGSDTQEPRSLSEFMNQKMQFNQTQLDLKKLDDWLINHPDAYVITDIKGDNIKGLKKMITSMNSAPAQVIPQMYHPENNAIIKAMGFKHIIFTLYATNLPYYQIIDFTRNNPLFAVTIHPDKRDFSAIIKGLKETNTYIYVHTYNTIEDLHKYQQMGADGLYTDFLYVDETGKVLRQH